MAQFQLLIDVDDDEADLREAYAQGVANVLGRRVELREQRGKNKVLVAVFEPRARR